MSKTPNEKLRVAHIRKNPKFNIHNGFDYADFFRIVRELETKRGGPLCIVELGTRRWKDDLPTHHRGDFEKSGIDVSNFIMSDYMDGLDVDKKVDLHEFTTVFPELSVDVIFSASTFEHVKYPWIASHELMKSLKLDGIIFIQTHQTFPLHGFPYDFYRFSRPALESLFPVEMGMKLHNSYYEFLNEIVPQIDIVAESYSNVCITVQKVSETPSEWRYNFK